MMKTANGTSLILLLILVSTSTGCGILFGNVKPVEEKSDTYHVLDLSRGNGDWKKIENSSSATNESTAIPDVTYQSEKTANIISLNSACRNSSNHSLKEVSRQLLLGMTEIQQQTENELKIQNIPALETTTLGKMNEQNVMLRTVVIQKDSCVFDLMYVSKPDRFVSQEADFSRFVSSLQLK